MTHVTPPHPVIISRQERVGVITLNKPEKLNAWDREMRNDIVAALRNFDADPEIGAVIMTGAGERAFSAGQDFADWRGTVNGRRRKTNPFMSAWLSSANKVMGSARGQAAAASKRQAASMQAEATKQIVDFWSGKAAALARPKKRK